MMVLLAGLSNRWEAFAQLLTLLVIFIFVLALTYFATRWAGNIQKNRLSGSNIRILETMRVTNTKYIQIVSIGSKCFAIAVCKDTITYLCELDRDELVYSHDSGRIINTEGFKAVLDKFRAEKTGDETFLQHFKNNNREENVSEDCDTPSEPGLQSEACNTQNETDL